MRIGMIGHQMIAELGNLKEYRSIAIYIVIKNN